MEFEFWLRNVARLAGKESAIFIFSYKIPAFLENKIKLKWKLCGIAYSVSDHFCKNASWIRRNGSPEPGLKKIRKEVKNQEQSRNFESRSDYEYKYASVRI